MPMTPDTQHAIQLTGPGQLQLNRGKPVLQPGPYQILARIEAVGLCFSDLKLLHQFSAHPRKGPIVSGIAQDILGEIPSYVPNEKPTVPGHEACCRIVAVGLRVKHHKVGERCLVQTDYRTLRTAGSGAAFGYNFEGALQEYVLMDERIIMDPESGERFLIPVPEDLSASAVALVEPWACVEDSYVTVERRTIKRGGRMLVVADPGAVVRDLVKLFSDAGGAPATLLALCTDPAHFDAFEDAGMAAKRIHDLAEVPNESLDDILYFGADPQKIETLSGKLGARGLFAIVRGGKSIGRPVSIGVGRIHYGLTRWVGTPGNNPRDAYGVVPETGELRQDDTLLVVGAGGPMGQMHVIRGICSGIANVSVTCADIDDTRLESLMARARPLAAKNRVKMTTLNTTHTPLKDKYSYIAIMVPAGPMVADAIKHSARGTLINIFAGIPAATQQALDLDTYINNRCYMFGTSGSVIRDMKIVLDKVIRGQLDTDCSVDAVSGMNGAIDGMTAVEKRMLNGKIIVYPMLHDLPLVPLSGMKERLPSVAAQLADGQWNARAEQELLKTSH